MSKYVIHRDGKKELFQTEQIIKAIQDLLTDLSVDDGYIAMFKIIKNFELKMPEEVTTEEIDQLLLKAIEGLITDDPMYDRIASAQLAKITNKKVGQRFGRFKEFIEYGIQEKLLREDLLNFDIDDLERHMQPSRDKKMNFFAMANFVKKYQMRDYSGKQLEKIQWTWMRMAMGIAFVEVTQEERNSVAKALYDQYSQLKYLQSHSYNSGSPRSQMSSCFISVVDDSMEHIMAKATEGAQLSKYDGGMGISFTKLRAAGSLIKKINQISSGPIPFIKVFDTIKNAMLQGTGKKRSGMVFYMEPWHLNIYEFLDLKETAGNDYVRARTCNTALRIPDEFMKRVQRDQDWWLFDPSEVEELTESWGEEFEAHYARYVAKAEAGAMKLSKCVKARELYREMCLRLAKTGNYWFTYKDTHNRYNQAPSYGNIHSSNLCTEISIANRGDSTAVCTISSLNLAAFVDIEKYKETKNYKPQTTISVEEKLACIKWDELKETVHLGIRALDNIVEFNFYPYPDAEKNSRDLRPLGLGVMGFADMLLDLDVAYDSKEALEIIDKLGAFMRHEATEESKYLATIKGPFRDYDASRYDYAPRRNILLLAIAPTASISLLCGVSSGIDSNFAMVYSRENQFGKFTVICERLIYQLKAQGLWNEEVKNSIINNHGSIQHLEALEGKIDKNLFKTAYEFSPTAQIDIAAAWQKHIDQGISRNMYFDESLRESIGDYYMYAWEQGLKSTYYCFIQKTLQGEKYTQEVNKRGERVGFGGETKTNTKTNGEDAVSLSSGFSGKRGFGGGASRGFGSVNVVATETLTVTETPSEIIEQVSLTETVEISTSHDLSDIDRKNATEADKARIIAKLSAEKGEDYVADLKAGKLYNGNCPVDPFERLICESCE